MIGGANLQEFELAVLIVLDVEAGTLGLKTGSLIRRNGKEQGWMPLKE
jgi:hypothetical protein